MKRIGWMLGLVLLLGSQVVSQAAGLIIIHDPEMPEPPIYRPPWPNPPPHHPPHWMPRPIHRFTALEVKSLEASAKITGQVAETKIEQVFYNPNPRQLEGTFMLPLPKGAHLKDFRMEVNGKMMEAELLPADKAKRTYEEIVRQVKDPALLEYVGQDLLKVRIFPIEGHSTKRIELSYSQLLAADGGLVEYQLPLDAAKYCAQPIGSFSLKLEVKSATPLKTLYSPSHEIEVVRHEPGRATVGLEETQVKPEKNFHFFYSAEPRELGIDFLAYKEEGEDGYFMLIASPGVEVEDDRVVPKDVVFVLDTSGSMSGEKMEQAKKALQYCVNSLNEGDRFEVIRFATEAEGLFGEVREASSENQEEAGRFVEKMKAAGGTAIHAALEKALEMRPGTEGRPFMVVFLTDGRPTVGITGEEQIVQDVKDWNEELTRVFCFGLGTDVNTHLLDKIAEETSAVTQYVLPQEDIEVKVSGFFAKINEPVLAGVDLDYGKVRTRQVHPGKLPDLFQGQQLIVLGRYTEGGKSTAKLSGSVGEEKKEFEYTLDFPEKAEEHDFIPRLWAMRRVGYLLDEIRLHGKAGELEEEVTELAKKYGIVTPYTSYLVVEDSPERSLRLGEAPAGQPAPQPLRRNYTERVVNAAPPATPLYSRSRPAATGLPAVSAPVKTGDTAVLNSRYGLALKGAQTGEALARVQAEYRSLSGAAGEAGSNAVVPAGRFVGGRMFHREGEVWVDSEVAGMQAETEKIKIEFNSPEYFELAGRHPKAREWLALGDRVTFVLEGKIYEIAPAEAEAGK